MKRGWVLDVKNRGNEGAVRVLSLIGTELTALGAKKLPSLMDPAQRARSCNQALF